MININIRFVRNKSIAEGLISWREGVCMPFPPTHSECVTPDGKWLGQHGFGGMQAREAGYDHDEVDLMPDGRRCEIIVPLPVTEVQHDAFYAYMHSKIGMPYDWVSILGFLATEQHLHIEGSLVCSAIVAAGLRTEGCEYFKWPMTKPFHQIDPATLMLILSTHVEIPH
jgi:hypothetical protein